MMEATYQLPRIRPISPRRGATISVLDVGTSKTICLIARLDPIRQPQSRIRTHTARILGIGYQRSRGLKGGQVVDMEGAECAARLAVDAAERMANLQVEQIVVTTSGGRVRSRQFEARGRIEDESVTEADVRAVLESALKQSQQSGRAILHAIPTRFSVDAADDVRDPRGMVGTSLGARLHVASCDLPALSNLRLAIERSHLSVSALVAAAYAAGLSVLTDDEMEIGATVVDFGGGTTSTAIFEGGALVHLDAIALGGQNVTLDVARGLNIRLSAAERLKSQHGGAQSGPADDRETIAIEHVGDESGRLTHLPRAQLVRIIKPRIEEILELTRDRLRHAGVKANSGSRLALTGGACQLAGMQEAAQRILGGQARIGRPLGVEGLPESGKSPSFAAAAGALIYPQTAANEHVHTGRERFRSSDGEGGYFARVGRWLKGSF